MKIRKRAEQQAFSINRDFYTIDENTWNEFERIIKLENVGTYKNEYLVFAEDLEEIKVVVAKEDGRYYNQATTIDGEKIMVNL